MENTDQDLILDLINDLTTSHTTLDELCGLAYRAINNPCMCEKCPSLKALEQIYDSLKESFDEIEEALAKY